MARGFPFASRPSDAAGLRPRLKLSPTSADTQVSQVFEAPPEPAQSAPPESGGWSWQELLSSMDDAPVEDRQLADRMIGEIEGLGVDIAALLPRARTDEIAAVMEAGDAAGVREVIRRLAPAAVRRLSRRALAERALRAHAERFVERYSRAVQEALAIKSRDAFAVANLLATDEGRAFLLFDAALGDLR